MKTQSQTEVQAPLTLLSKRLTTGPPSIKALIHLLDQGEMVMEFVRIVREFLPDREAEIMARCPDERVEAFCGLFSERYFPLDDGWVMDEDDYYALVTSIPIHRAAISYDDYHEIEGWRPPFLLMLAIIASPWDDDGARVPLLEECAKIVGEDLIKLIPARGWEPAELHRCLDGNTPLEGVALFASSLWRETDTVFLDVDYEEDLMDLDWNRETVEYLTERWPRAVQIQERIREVEQWLEKAPAENFRHLLNTIRATPKKKNRTLVEVFAEEARA